MSADRPAPTDPAQIRHLPVACLRPGRYQTRARFPDDGLRESIAQSGVVQPVIVRSVDDGFELIAGERRWRAAQALGRETIPALVRDDLDEVEVATLCLVENIQRENLNPIEEARGFALLIERFGLSHAEVAARTGKSRPAITNALRLLQLDAAVQERVLDGEIEAGHARTLVGLTPAAQADFAQRVVRHGWSVRQLEAEVARFKALFAGKPREKPATQARSPDIVRLENRLSEATGLPVSVDYDEAKGQGGVIRIRFFDLDAVQPVLARLLGASGAHDDGDAGRRHQ